MPTVIDGAAASASTQAATLADRRPAGPRRRQWLAGAAALMFARHAPAAWGGVASGVASGGAAIATQIVAAWDDAGGRHHIGLLQADTQGARVLDAIEVPTRAHGLACGADGSVLAVARRPGDWLLRWQPGRATRPGWCWADADRRFNGHLLLAADGGALYTTEIDLDSGQGCLVRRDASTLEAMAIWPTAGLDPHDLEWLPDGQLLVANGGITTLPETGRVKLAPQCMDSSLVRLRPCDGAISGQWRLADARLSLRHLARHASGLVGVALQAEHDDPAERAQAPLLAWFDPATERLRTVPAARSASGYAGDIAARPEGWLLSCPREHQVQRLRLHGPPDAALALPAACALVSGGAALGAWVLGHAALLHEGQPSGEPDASWPSVLAAGCRFDNHAVAWPQPPQGAGPPQPR